MKTNKFITVVLCAAIMIPVLAQNVLENNTVRAIKLKELTIKKESLEKQINAEDKKRSKDINGLTFETQEKLNDRQDSICLALRSQLVSVELEIKELERSRANDAEARVKPL